MGAQHLSSARVAVIVLAAAVVAVGAFLVPRALPGVGLSPVEDEAALAADRLGGLGTLLTVEPVPDVLEGCLGDEALPEPVQLPDGASQIPGLIERVTEVRQLDYDERPDPRLLDPDEMAAEVARRFGAGRDVAELEAESATLARLGAVPVGTDLFQWRVHTFAEQVSGLYTGSPEGVHVRIEDPTGLSPLEQVVLAHELQHALSDQQLGRPTQAEGRATLDQRRARLALVEGDATLTMAQLMLADLSPQDREQLRVELIRRVEEGVLDGWPHYLMEELRWPYREGLAFVCALYGRAGWQAVNEAYDDPPRTSAQILFAERYLAGEAPATPPRLRSPGEGWDEIRDATFGAAELWWLLTAPGGDPEAAIDDALERAAGWDGGTVTTWSREEHTAVGLSLVQREGALSLCETAAALARATFGDAEEERTADGMLLAGHDVAAVVACDAGEVRFAVAPDVEVARRITR